MRLELAGGLQGEGATAAQRDPNEEDEDEAEALATVYAERNENHSTPSNPREVGVSVGFYVMGRNQAHK